MSFLHHRAPYMSIFHPIKVPLIGHVHRKAHSYGPLPVISTYNLIYRMYNPIEITSYNSFQWP